jgi:hypothetical protein
MGIDKVAADVLSRTTYILRSGSDADINRLRQYLMKFKLEELERAPSIVRYAEEVNRILHDLSQIDSTEEANKMLEDFEPTKELLTRVLREIGVPVAKSDKLEHLKLKIVHETVETRLNSEAIRNPYSKRELKKS